MCEVTEDESLTRRLESLAAEVDRLKAENQRLLRDRRRVAGFVGSAAWDALNERRAELIGRDTGAGLSDAERAEFATLQLAVDVLIGVRDPLPEPDDGAWKEALIRSLQGENERLKAEVEQLRERTERAERVCRLLAEHPCGCDDWMCTPPGTKCESCQARDVVSGLDTPPGEKGGAT